MRSSGTTGLTRTRGSVIVQGVGVKRKTSVAMVGLVVGLIVGFMWVTVRHNGVDPTGSFWEQLSFGGGTVEVEYYSSLQDAVRSADLVVKGTVTSVRFGRTWGNADALESQVSSVLMDVAVAEVLQGNLPGANRVVTVERQVFAYRPDDLKAMIRNDGIMVGDRLAALPSDEALFVLRARSDANTEIVAAAQPVSGTTYRLVNSQGLITEHDDGNARLPLSKVHVHESPEDKVREDYFHDSVSGATFDDVVARARATS